MPFLPFYDRAFGDFSSGEVSALSLSVLVIAYDFKIKILSTLTN